MGAVKNHYHDDLERRRAVENGYCGECSEEADLDEQGLCRDCHNEANGPFGVGA